MAQKMNQTRQLPEKILDPTKIGTWNIVRRPPLDTKTPIQGRIRAPISAAYKTHQLKEGIRLRKALKAMTHGKNIFVYHNMRTNQVVYSLTRYLEKTNVLRQMVFHGKKTVPATLRKDMWIPFYSVHFNNPQVGLRAFHLLREFSMQRQLAPPREMITINEETLAKRRPREPAAAKSFDEKFQSKIGQLMPPPWRARVVMDQKATSVADVAAVIAIQEEEIRNGFANGKRGYLTWSVRKRRRLARQRNKELAEKDAARIAEFQENVLNDPQFQRSVPSELKTRQVISLPTDDPNSEYHLEGDQVKILWNDLFDASFAQSWPERVVHGELDWSRDHVMASQKPLLYGLETLGNSEFKEKEPEKQTE